MSNPAVVPHPAVSGGPIGLGAPSIPGTNVDFCFVGLVGKSNALFSCAVTFSYCQSLFMEIHLFVASLKHPRTPPTNSSMDYPSGDPDHVAKRTRPLGIADEVLLFLFSDDKVFARLHF